ncbi:hypothetical protein HOLleu_00837 [Holothuria leucospilota]|uniref:Uncharacterized protein n=1 Tax=Holothuria leucospilota TaxID=206669 RepID=A0A9Q1CMQ8_HOLLE|nr:hypothetical protein HOLleu_00837 [Holothuria leucospilota]
MEHDNTNADEIDKFLIVFEMMRDFISDAVYEVTYNRQARRTISECEDATNSAWVSQQQLASIIDTDEQALISEIRIAYLKGKGNSNLEPVLITSNFILAIKPFKGGVPLIV